VINGWNSGKQNEDNLNKDLVKVYLRFVSNPLWQWRPSKHALLVEKHGQNTCTIENKTSSIEGFMVIQKEREKKIISICLNISNRLNNRLNNNNNRS
jgi:hypothetical protein